MDLKDIIKIADEAYPDGMIGQYFDEAKNAPVSWTKSEGIGDGLARFLCVELCETYDKEASDEDQLDTASRCINNAAKELDVVVGAFEDAIIKYKGE